MTAEHSCSIASHSIGMHCILIVSSAGTSVQTVMRAAFQRVCDGMLERVDFVSLPA